VNTTGQAVRRGEALLEVYSPDLVLAQREYLVARSAAADMAQADILARDNAKAIAAAALSRLKNWDISADQLARLQRTGVATRTLTLSAPIGGIVMEKPALQGLQFGVGAGDMLYRIGCSECSISIPGTLRHLRPIWRTPISHMPISHISRPASQRSVPSAGCSKAIFLPTG
jgi:hypothetical protein